MSAKGFYILCGDEQPLPDIVIYIDIIIRDAASLLPTLKFRVLDMCTVCSYLHISEDALSLPHPRFI